MMSKTHITIGIAASLAVCRPSTFGEILAAVAGGCTGGILCDIECRSQRWMRDAAVGRIIAFSIVLITLCIDYFAGFGIISGITEAIQQKGWMRFVTGSLIFLATCIIGRFSEHRTFTHSLLFVLLIGLGLYFITPELSIPTITGGISHLVIDTFNKKPIPWLFPFVRSGICLKLCYANKLGNTVLMWIGLVLSIVLLGWSIYTIIV